MSSSTWNGAVLGIMHRSLQIGLGCTVTAAILGITNIWITLNTDDQKVMSTICFSMVILFTLITMFRLRRINSGTFGNNHNEALEVMKSVHARKAND